MGDELKKNDNVMKDGELKGYCSFADKTSGHHLSASGVRTRQADKNLYLSILVHLRIQHYNMYALSIDPGKQLKNQKSSI